MKTIKKIILFITLFCSQLVIGQDLFNLSEDKLTIDLNERYTRTISASYVVDPVVVKVVDNKNIEKEQSISFKLNDGVLLSAELSEIENSDNEHYTWAGRPTNYKENGEYVILDVAKTGITGVIWYKSKMYEIKPISDIYHVIYQVDQSKVSKDDTYNYFTGNSVIENVTKNVSVPKTIQYYDVLAVYTPAAKFAADPNAMGDPTYIESTINIAKTQANIVYYNSIVPVRIGNIYKEEISYTEISQEIDVNRLTGTSDGYMDNVHSMRTNYGADVVILFEVGGTAAGRAKGIWVDAANAFAVVNHQSAITRYTFVHEIGHLFGGEHEVEFDDWEYDPEPYNHVYTHAKTGLPNFQTLRGVKGDGSVYREPYLSSPFNTAQIDGYECSLGDNVSDNVTLVHSERASTIAGFYDPPLLVNVTGPTLLIGTQGGAKAPQYQAIGTWYVNASGGVGNYTYQWQYDGYNGWTDYSGETGTFLTKTLYYDANGHDLRCVVTSGSQTENDEIHVYVTGDIFLKSNPNPFNPTTDLKFHLFEESNVIIEIFNIKGQKVTTLVNSTYNVGGYSVKFDGSNLESGIYICKMTSISMNTQEISTAVNRLILLK